MIKIESKKIERINFLAKKAKTEGLTEAEKAEQASLRQEYMAGFRKSLAKQLDNTYILTPDGKKRKITKKKD